MLLRNLIAPYLYLAKASILARLAYRIEAFAGFAINLVPLVSLVFLWKSAFGGTPQIAGVSQEQMITYSILSVALKDVFFFSTQDNLLSAVQRGNIAVDLLRPYNVLGRYLAEDVANSFGTFARRFLPLLFFSAIFIAIPKPASVPAGILFAISTIFSYFILWALSALAGLVAFWTMEVGNLGMVKDAIVRTFSGSVIPLWFFPEAAQRFLNFLPFKYTYQTPLEIYIGKSGFALAAREICIQMAWAAGLGLLVFFVWRKAKIKLMIQGG